MINLIRTIASRLNGNDQRGGIAILTALGFLLFSVPLITASLDLAQATSIDARVKTDITHRQYCGLGTQAYLDYLLADTTRWTDWLAANVDPADPSGATSTETVDPCGRNVTISVAQQLVLPPNSTDPDADNGGSADNPVGLIPPLSAYGNRNFQTSKTVSNPNPEPGESVLYTITITNRDDSPTSLTRIDENLPPGFSYDCNGPDNILSIPGQADQVIVPFHDECPDADDLDFDWHMPAGTSVPSGESVTLTFTAITSNQAGTYCNEVSVNPGGSKTTNGRTATVQIGDQAGQCSDDAVSVVKTVDSLDLVSTDTSSADYVYTFDIDYMITVTNTGSTELEIKEYIDLLPEGFSYVSTSSSEDITETPHNLHDESQVNRQRVTWKFDDEIELDPGESKSMIITTVASIERGDYWSDLLVDFDGGAFAEDRYTWPTALISVRDVYTVTATDDQGNSQVIDAQVWFGDQDGAVQSWTLP